MAVLLRVFRLSTLLTILAALHDPHDVVRPGIPQHRVRLVLRISRFLKRLLRLGLQGVVLAIF